MSWGYGMAGWIVSYWYVVYTGYASRYNGI